MDRQKINRMSAIAPIVMSLMALALVLAAAATGWETHDTDEGTAAHIFQLLIAAQAPIVLLFLATADWKRFMPIVRTLAGQAAALIAAFAPVAYFNL
jgi:hypothetical protein